jgi:hypothetical protein
MRTAIDLISEERSRQVVVEGWSPEHDDEHVYGELSRAAACYCLPKNEVDLSKLDGVSVYGVSEDGVGWPWESPYKPTPNDPIRQLVKAGALIVAEIERLQRIEAVTLSDKG